MKLDLMDCLVILAIAFTLIAHGATIYVEVKAAGVSGIAAAGTSLEANPGQRQIQGLNYFSQFLVDGALYGLLLGAYVFFKKRARKDTERMLMLWVFVCALFMLSAMDVSNDLAYIVAIGI